MFRSLPDMLTALGAKDVPTPKLLQGSDSKRGTCFFTHRIYHIGLTPGRSGDTKSGFILGFPSFQKSRTLFTFHFVYAYARNPQPAGIRF
jgi:hypothetical protein